MQLPAGDAETIYNVIKKYLKENDIYHLLSSFCSDGAKVLCSTQEGVAGKLIRDNPKILSLHCFAHRINLISGDLIDHFPELKLFNSMVYNLCKVFKRSTKRLQILEAAEFERLKYSKKLIQPIKVRWFSLFNAIKRIQELYPSLIEALNEISKSDIKAAGIASKIKTFEFVFYLNFLCDLLEVLNILNKAFQKNDLSYARVNILISSIKRQVDNDYSSIDNIRTNENMANFLKEFEKKSSFKGK